MESNLVVVCIAWVTGILGAGIVTYGIWQDKIDLWLLKIERKLRRSR